MEKKAIEAFIDQAKNSLITTIDEEGFPVTRAMLSVRRREELKTLYFSTNTSSNKISEVKRNAKGSVYFFNAEQFVGVLLKGHFEVSQEPEIKRSIWQLGDDYYYPKGVEDEDYSVLIFRIEMIRVYSDLKEEIRC